MFIVYEGKSRFNSEEIVAILTKGSTNEKTGDMHQLYILPKHEAPNIAVKTGNDESICGNCKHRNGSCYVLTFQGPLNVWRAYRNGSYKAMPKTWKTFKPIRFGAYGDASMLPIDVLKDLLTRSAHWTNYTHQWQEFKDDTEFLRSFSMASVDSLQEAKEARSMGYRTFRVTAEDDKQPNEIWCPNLTHGINCLDCLLCDGGNKAKAKNIVIPVHGAAHKIKAFKNLSL